MLNRLKSILFSIAKKSRKLLCDSELFVKLLIMRYILFLEVSLKKGN